MTFILHLHYTFPQVTFHVFNQKIVDYVVTATSPEQVAELIQVIK